MRQSQFNLAKSFQNPKSSHSAFHGSCNVNGKRSGPDAFTRALLRRWIVISGVLFLLG